MCFGDSPWAVAPSSANERTGSVRFMADPQCRRLICKAYFTSEWAWSRVKHALHGGSHGHSYRSSSIRIPGCSGRPMGVLVVVDCGGLGLRLYAPGKYPDGAHPDTDLSCAAHCCDSVLGL